MTALNTTPFPATIRKAHLSSKNTVEILGLGVFIVALMLCSCLAFLVMFTTFKPYDDEGWQMFTIRRMLDGKALYHDMKIYYGPTYYLTRWLIFGVGHLPLNNDTSRCVSLATWILETLLIGLAGRAIGGWFAGAFAITIGVTALAALANEPGHSQEVHILLLIIALTAGAYWQKKSSSASDRWFWFILGATVPAMALVKINVGLFFGLAVIGAMSVYLVRGRLSRIVFAIFCAGLLGLPWVLTGNRAAWTGFAELTALSLAPLCAALFLSPPGAGMDRRQWLSFLTGAFVGAIVPITFALLQGNSIADMLFAMVTRPRRDFAHLNLGWGALHVTNEVAAFAAANACIGYGMLILSRRHRQPPTRMRAALLAARFVALAYLIAALAGIAGHLMSVVPMAWLMMIESPGQAPPGDRTRFFRRLVAFTTCLMPLQIYPVAGSQLLMGTLPLVLLAVMILCDTLADIRSLRSDRVAATAHAPRHIGWPGALAAVLWTMTLIPSAALGKYFQTTWTYWEWWEPMNLPGCRLTRVREPDAAVYRFLAANVGAFSDGYLSRTGLNSLHWWANSPLLSSSPIGNTWSIVDANTDADLLASYSARPGLMFLDRASFFPGQEIPDLKIARFLRANFRPLACAWDWTLFVRKDRPDSISMTDLKSCAFIVSQTRVHADANLTSDYVIQVCPGNGASLEALAHFQVLDYADGTMFSHSDISPKPVGSFQLTIHGNDIDLSKFQQPAVRLLDAEGRVLQILPIIFAPAPNLLPLSDGSLDNR